MEPIINHTFTVPYVQPTEIFEFRKYNSIVGYESYKERIIPKIEDIAYELHKNPKSRQAVINVNEGSNHMSCLLNYQFQISDNKLYVTANYRSMCAKWGMTHDIQLVNYVIFRLKLTPIFRLYFKDIETIIQFNIANFHERTDITC